MPNKSSLEHILKSVLSVGNAEQNMAYAPYIFDSHYNIVTSFLIDKMVELYPANQDVILPFIEKAKLPVSSGAITLPDNYRNLLGAPSISVRPDGSNCDDPVLIDTKSEFKTANLKSGCKSVPVTIVGKDEWDYRTTSEYAFPKHESPIGIFEGRKIRVCPYDISRVELMYVRKEKIYKFGYIQQPDDTYLYDANTTIESEWDEAAFEFLFRGVFALYSAYSRDNAITEWGMILNKAGLI